MQKTWIKELAFKLFKTIKVGMKSNEEAKIIEMSLAC